MPSKLLTSLVTLSSTASALTSCSLAGNLASTALIRDTMMRGVLLARLAVDKTTKGDFALTVLLPSMSPDLVSVTPCVRTAPFPSFLLSKSDVSSATSAAAVPCDPSPFSGSHCLLAVSAVTAPLVVTQRASRTAVIEWLACKAAKWKTTWCNPAQIGALQFLLMIWL